MNINNLKAKRIFLAHSNTGAHMKQWHMKREMSAKKLGYNLETFCMTDLYPYTTFPSLDKKWRKRDPDLMKFYEILGERINLSDIFIHYNGALIHPEFLEQFKQLKIYHCADDPDASSVLSHPVVSAYDIHAISNPSCIEMYKSWGCKHVFFWPLGAFHYDDHYLDDVHNMLERPRDVRLSFVGSKFGTNRFRYLSHIPIVNRMSFVHNKKFFFDSIERSYPFIHGYGTGWGKGYIGNEKIPELYSRTQIGINVHNSLGPVNGRLYDLAAYGVCQICDNKKQLSQVFKEGHEIIGFDSKKECVDLIRYYLNNSEEASVIGEAGRERYLREYTMDNIWRIFFKNIDNYKNYMQIIKREAG
jgi:hypothetical protein